MLRTDKMEENFSFCDIISQSSSIFMTLEVFFIPHFFLLVVFFLKFYT